MLRRSGAFVMVLCALAGVAFAGAEKAIDAPRTLAGDWRSVGDVTRAAIHINEDGTYQGIAATGARTNGRITVTKGKASYQSSTSEGIVTLSQEGGKDVLTFVPSNGRGSAKLEREGRK